MVLYLSWLPGRQSTVIPQGADLLIVKDMGDRLIVQSRDVRGKFSDVAEVEKPGVEPVRVVTDEEAARYDDWRGGTIGERYRYHVRQRKTDFRPKRQSVFAGAARTEAGRPSTPRLLAQRSIPVVSVTAWLARRPGQ